MENNYERMGMPELKALAKMNGLRGYSRLRKADLIRFIRENEPSPQTMIDETMGSKGTRAKPIDKPLIEKPQNANILSESQKKT